jgi:hypothetical protein
MLATDGELGDCKLVHAIVTLLSSNTGAFALTPQASVFFIEMPDGASYRRDIAALVQ